MRGTGCEFPLLNTPGSVQREAPRLTEACRCQFGSVFSEICCSREGAERARLLSWRQRHRAPGRGAVHSPVATFPLPQPELGFGPRAQPCGSTCMSPASSHASSPQAEVQKQLASMLGTPKGMKQILTGLLHTLAVSFTKQAWQ